jgi:uncharacterized glyoxalase superfamily protein PhnB
MGTQIITPYLYYEDVQAAMRFLAEAFGFVEREDETFWNDDGKIVHAAMTLDGATLMMGCPGAGYRNPKALGGNTHSLYVYVPDVDAHLARAKAAGAPILSGPENTFYGDRRYRTEDPEGHEWFFAQKLGEVPATESQPKSGDRDRHD